MKLFRKLDRLRILKSILISFYFLPGLAVLSQTVVKPPVNQSASSKTNTVSDRVNESTATFNFGAGTSANGGAFSSNYTWKSSDADLSQVLKPNTILGEPTNGITVSDANSNSTDEIKIYPNLQQGALIIESADNCVVSLITLDGKTLWTEKITDKQTFILPETKGIYLLKIQTSQKTSIRKIIVN